MRREFVNFFKLASRHLNKLAYKQTTEYLLSTDERSGMTVRKKDARRRSPSAGIMALGAVLLVAALGAANAIFANDTLVPASNVTTNEVKGEEAATPEPEPEDTAEPGSTDEAENDVESKTPTPEPEPVEVTGEAKFKEFTCEEGSENGAVAPSVKDGVWTFTDKNGDSFVTKVGEGYEGEVPEGLAYGKIDVTLRDGGSDDLTKVIPGDVSWTPVNPDDLDCDSESEEPVESEESEESVEPEPVQVTGNFYAEIISCEEGTRNFVEYKGVEDAIGTFKDEQGNTFSTAVGEGYEGGLPEGLTYGLVTFVVADAGTDETVEVVAYNGAWTPVNPDDLDCDSESEEPVESEESEEPVEPEPEPEEPQKPAQVSGSVFPEVLSCADGTRNYLVSKPVEDGITTLTDSEGNTFETGVGEGYEGDVPEGLKHGQIVIVVSDAGTDNSVEVVASDWVWTPVHVDDLDCVVKDAEASVAVVTDATCTDDSKVEHQLKHSTAVGEPMPGKDDTMWKQEFVADAGHAFKDGKTSLIVDYGVAKATGFKSDDPSDPCYKAEETPAPQAESNGPQSPDLALTGVELLLIGVASVAGLGLLAIGVMALAYHRRKKREAAAAEDEEEADTDAEADDDADTDPEADTIEFSEPNDDTVVLDTDEDPKRP